jgi:hypothetical protein
MSPRCFALLPDKAASRFSFRAIARDTCALAQITRRLANRILPFANTGLQNTQRLVVIAR